MKRIPLEKTRPFRLWRLFERARRLFARCQGAADAELVLADGPCTMPGKCAHRDLAYALPDERPPKIVVLRRLADFPDENVLGLLFHEFGHLCDTETYHPAGGHEQLADDIAEHVTGFRISYDENDVQTIGPGKWPRPKYLHR